MCSAAFQSANPRWKVENQSKYISRVYSHAHALPRKVRASVCFGPPVPCGTLRYQKNQFPVSSRQSWRWRKSAAPRATTRTTRPPTASPDRRSPASATECEPTRASRSLQTEVRQRTNVPQRRMRARLEGWGRVDTERSDEATSRGRLGLFACKGKMN